MRRLLLIPVALLGLACAGAFASIKQANAHASGKISSLSATSITVGKKHHPHLTCGITAYSPSAGTFAVGDRVKLACSNHVLVAIADLPGAANSKNDASSTTGISGTVTGIGSGKTSITVHDGDRTVTCTVGPGSPSITGLGVGDRVKIGCADGILVYVGTPPGPGTTTTATTTTNVTNANGPITALTDGSISVQTMPCTIGPSSPSTAGFKIGDSVRMYCLNGALYQLKHNETPPPPPPTTTTTTTTATTTTTSQNYSAITGTITAISDESITVVNTGGGDGPPTLTCIIGPTSPSHAGFTAGNLVRMYCLNGALYQLKHNDSTPPPTNATTTTTTTTTTTQQNYSGISGTLTALSDGSITTTNTGDGDGPPTLTCTIGPSSPSRSGFSVGSLVRMYCLNGVLYQLKHNDPAPPSTSTTTTSATTTTGAVYTEANGTLHALGSDSITVADLTCTIGPSSPSTSGFTVNQSVRMYCQNGALYSLSHN